jgi:protein required for attachment to host cells
MKPVKTWIVIADGARARILAHEGPGKGLHPVDGALFEADHAPTGDINADRPGRAYDSEGEGRHGLESAGDPHRNAKESFAGVVADYLAQEARNSAYDRLILIAAPITLGDLRKGLPSSLDSLVMGEVAKDLTQVPNQDIGGYLDELLVI